MAQLGGYWLPFLHILMLPTIWNDFFWQTGISGSIPNMIAYICGALFLYKFIFAFTRSKFSGILATLIFALNRNLLYMQTTPMTESLFISTLIISIYFFYKWTIRGNMSSLIISGFFAFLSSFNRYEGWMLVLGTNAILLLRLVKNKFHKKHEGAFLLFSTISSLGILLWITWGFALFGDPLHFLHNELSAGRQTQTEFNREDITGYHNIPMSILTNIFAIKHTEGITLLFISTIGLIIFFIKYWRKLFSFQLKYIFVFLLFTPLIFDIYTVFTGNVPVEIPELSRLSPPGNHFNIRYALYSLPLSVFFAFTITKKKLIQFIFFLVIMINYTFFLHASENTIVTLTDAGAKSTKEFQEDLQWFENNYNGQGLIVASTGSNDKFMFETGVYQKNFITEGTYRLWEESMHEPAKYAVWIIISTRNKRDMVNVNINQEKLHRDFSILYQNGGWIVFEKKFKT